MSEALFLVEEQASRAAAQKPAGASPPGPKSLVEELATVPDPRSRKGRRHPLTAILSLTVVATLAGMKSLEAIAQFGRDHGPALAHALGFTRGKTPTTSCLSKLFRRLDIAAVEEALGRWVRGRVLHHGWDDIALDGKTARGSADGDVPGVHLLTAYVPAAAAVLKQMRVDAKTNEHKAALKLLGVLPLAGKGVSGDALFTHRDFAQEVRDGGGDYLLIVKDNQPERKAQIQSALHEDADFSPLPTEAEGGPGADGEDGGQGARTQGVPAADEHDGAQRLPGLAGRRSGVRVGAGTRAEGQDRGGGGLRDNQPGARPERRHGPAATGARPLGDRERAALRPG
jgi:DDE_Tnp_1-associated/Transposase DDE domain